MRRERGREREREREREIYSELILRMQADLANKSDYDAIKTELR